MPISELARSTVITAEPDDTAQHLATMMDDEDVGSIPVVEDDRPVGLVTDRDLTLEVVSRGGDPASLTATDVMTEDLFTVAANDGIYEVLTQASERSVRRIPVVDDDGRLTGIVTLDDFVVLLSGEFEDVADIIQAESPPY